MLVAEELREELLKEIIGQDKAIEAVVRAVLVAELGICDPRRPLASFLFLGPTGVGKSQLPRSLARILHGDEKEALVINATEFRNPHETAKLVGAPPGYIGHEHPPFITPEKIEKKLSVIIFEELEKADVAFFHLLLQVLERGELKTGQGVNLNFSNSLIFMTSNLGTSELDKKRSGGLGFHPAPALPIGPEDITIIETEKEEEVLCIKLAEDFFGLEFVNRFDSIQIFKRLDHKHLLFILEKFLLDSRARLALSGINTQITEEAKEFLIRKGTNLRYGARPLRRILREYFEFPIANLVAERLGEYKDRILRVDYDKKSDKLRFEALKFKKGAVFI